MDISYLECFEQAFSKMKKSLFENFSIKKWFIIGFAAFLAGLSGKFFFTGNGFQYQIDDFDINSATYKIDSVIQWLKSNPIWFIFALFSILFVLILYFVLLWVSSRAKFVFLDNVLNDSLKIKNPWKKYSKQGNTLFVWRFLFSIFCVLLIAGIVGLFFLTSINPNTMEIRSGMAVWNFILLVLFSIFCVLLIGYVYLFLDNFIVPIMYKHDLNILKAWKMFLKLYYKHPISFLIYGILYVLIYLLFSALILALGFMSCCLIFILLLIPYISSVITLPVSYTLRLLGVEFISQFGKKYNLYKNKS